MVKKTKQNKNQKNQIKNKDKTKQKSIKYTLNCRVLSGLAPKNKLQKFDLT